MHGYARIWCVLECVFELLIAAEARDAAYSAAPRGAGTQQ